MINRDANYVDGAWVPSTSGQYIDVLNPTTEKIIGRVPAGTSEDISAAVASARHAFDSWSTTTPAERAEWLGKLINGLTARSDEIARLVSSEVGMPYMHALEWQSALPIRNFTFYADLLTTHDFDRGKVRHSLVVQEPVGVVGCITPWNYPLHQVALKVAPAIAAGCTVVLKPSEIAPLTAFLLADVAHEAGLPPGVLNVVTGYGIDAGEALASHPDVDMISFTGSTRAGTRVSELAAPSVKRVALELGGKSANIVLEDADLELAVTDGVGNCYFNAGQTCTALTRLFVPRARLAEAEQIAKSAAESFRVGDPFEESTTLGPVVSKTQFERVHNLISSGVADGATLVTGGTNRPRAEGFFVAPTVFSSVTPQMRIGREEVFGPVLSILPYETEDEAVAMANDSEYGLSGGVWAGSEERGVEFARRLRTGQVSVNGGGFNNEAPFGGYKRSGLGREAGVAGLEEYLETKAIHLSS